jgi:hypothetical protein
MGESPFISIGVYLGQDFAEHQNQEGRKHYLQQKPDRQYPEQLIIDVGKNNIAYGAE